jgi:hypothetical protein
VHLQKSLTLLQIKKLCGTTENMSSMIKKMMEKLSIEPKKSALSSEEIMEMEAAYGAHKYVVRI